MQSKFREALQEFTWVQKDGVYFIPEDWSSPNEDEGECHVFVLLCNKKLREIGIKCHPIFCQTEEGQGHMVLGTPQGVLDIRQAEIVTLEALKTQGYSEFFTPLSTLEGAWKEI